jgi:hypothetical protein
MPTPKIARIKSHNLPPPPASTSHSTPPLRTLLTHTGINQPKIRVDQRGKILWNDAYHHGEKMKLHSQLMSIYYFVGINKGMQFCKK